MAPSPLPQRWPSRVTTTEPQSSGSTTRLDIFACFGSSRTLCSLRRREADGNEARRHVRTRPLRSRDVSDYIKNNLNAYLDNTYEMSIIDGFGNEPTGGTSVGAIRESYRH